MAKMAMLPRDDMTNREHIQQQLSAYIDGELDAADASAVAQALAADPELARELERLKATRELLRRLPVEHAPEDFAARVLAQTERRRLVHLHAPARQGINWLRYSLIAAVALIAVSVGLVTVIGIYSANKVHPNLLAANPAAHAPAPEEGFAVVDETARRATGKDGNRPRAIDLAERKMAEGQAADNNVLICTDDLPKARRELESQLGKNSIQFKSRWSGDEEAVVVADVDSSQVPRLNKVIDNLRSSNRGAELSGQQLMHDKCQEQAADAARSREKSAGDELNGKFTAAELQKRDDLAKKGYYKQSGGGAGGGKVAQTESEYSAATTPGGACHDAEDNKVTKNAQSHGSLAKPGDGVVGSGGVISHASGPTTRPAAPSNEALALADKTKDQSEHPVQKAPQSAPAEAPAAAFALKATASSQPQSYLRNQSNQPLALRVQITLQYHPALTQRLGAAQNQSGGPVQRNFDQTSQSRPAESATSRPDDSQQNADR
jgi:negative regulator of sigma E activity